jgi:hypothetical protein
MNHVIFVIFAAFVSVKLIAKEVLNFKIVKKNQFFPFGAFADYAKYCSEYQNFKEVRRYLRNKYI